MSDWTYEEKKALNGYIPKELVTDAEVLEYDDPSDTIDWGRNFPDDWRDRIDDIEWRGNIEGVEFKRGRGVVDWTKKLATVQRVKLQKTCGSSWAFATTGSIETHTEIATGEAIYLSEQQLIDCSS